MRAKYFLFAVTMLLTTCFVGEATIKIVSFKNESPIRFKPVTDDKRPYMDLIKKGTGFTIDKEGASISSEDGKYQIIFEDAGQSGFHRPHWKYHVWVKVTDGLPLLAGGKVLHSVFFYDGLGEMDVRLCPKGKLFIKGGRDVLNPWKVGTTGRGNPYHKIDHDKADNNGIAYFDNDGFVGYPYSNLRD